MYSILTRSEASLEKCRGKETPGLLAAGVAQEITLDSLQSIVEDRYTSTPWLRDFDGEAGQTKRRNTLMTD